MWPYVAECLPSDCKRKRRSLWGPAVASALSAIKFLNPFPHVVTQRRLPDCPNGCHLQNCRKRHDIQRCSCGALVRQQNEHIRGKKHTKMINASQVVTQNMPSIPASNPQIQRNYKDFKHCETCDKDIPLFRWEFHLNHPEHLRTQHLVDTQTALNGMAGKKMVSKFPVKW